VLPKLEIGKVNDDVSIGGPLEVRRGRPVVGISHFLPT
jgi:hypothetical protein